jgi:hypothetical protein
MKRDKVRRFMELAEQQIGVSPTPELRRLGAALILSEVLEYVVHGLGVTPEVNGMPIREPDQLKYTLAEHEPNEVEMIDGLADVAYTMFWNSIAFDIPVEQAFDLVADNNLEKFVRLDAPVPHHAVDGARLVPEQAWNLGKGVEWPTEVASVELVSVDGSWYAVGKDANGKVRKPSTYKPVDLETLVGTRAAG